MRRRIFDLTTVLSALLFAIFVAAWIASCFDDWQVTVDIREPAQHQARFRALFIYRGRIAGVWQTTVAIPPSGSHEFGPATRWAWQRTPPSASPSREWRLWLFHHEHSDPHQEGIFSQVHVDAFVAGVRLVPAMVLTVIAPAWWLRRRLRDRRNRGPGYCASCGYDLRATPDEHGPLLNACPECGATAAQSMHDTAKS